MTSCFKCYSVMNKWKWHKGKSCLILWNADLSHVLSQVCLRSSVVSQSHLHQCGFTHLVTFEIIFKSPPGNNIYLSTSVPSRNVWQPRLLIFGRQVWLLWHARQCNSSCNSLNCKNRKFMPGVSYSRVVWTQLSLRGFDGVVVCFK